MEIRGLEISEIPAIDIRNALREFNEDNSCHVFRDGHYTYVPKKLTAAFLASRLNIEMQLANELLRSLIKNGYIDTLKLVPTTKGMALCMAEDRVRLNYDFAKEILQKFLELVERENDRANARVFVERVFVFGSFERGEATVGDIDLIVEMPLPEDCIPEDMQEQDDLSKRLKISEYLSLHDELDWVAGAARKKMIYERAANKSN